MIIKILDRYILKEFVTVLIVSLFAFVAIFVIVDFLDFADNLIEKNARLVDIFYYYLLFIPFIYNIMSPPAMLMASLFAFNRMARRSEIIAIRSSGLSLLRIIRPILIVAALFTLGNIWISHSILPTIELKRWEVKQYQLYRRSPQNQSPTSQLSFRDKSQRFYFFYYYNPAQKTGYNVLVNTVESNYIRNRLSATKVSVSDTGWTFFDVRIWEYDPQGDIIKINNMPRYFDNSIKLLPEFFVKPEKKIQHMTWIELNEYIELLKIGGQSYAQPLMELYLRFSFPFAGFVTVLFGAPLAVRQYRRKSASIGFTISLLICFLYYGLQRVFQSMGNNGILDPFWSAWISNIIFGVMGITFLLSSNK